MDKTIENETEEEFETSPEEEKDTSKKPLEEDASQKTEEVDKDKLSLQAQKEHFKGKFEKSEEKLGELQKKLETLKKTQDKEPVSEDEWKQKIEFVVKHREVPADFIDEVSAYARGRSVSLEEGFKSDTMQSALKASLDKSRKEDKTPEPSSSTIQVEGKDISELSREEKTKMHPELVEKVLRARKKESFR